MKMVWWSGGVALGTCLLLLVWLVKRIEDPFGENVGSFAQAGASIAMVCVASVSMFAVVATIRASRDERRRVAVSSLAVTLTQMKSEVRLLAVPQEELDDDKIRCDSSWLLNRTRDLRARLESMKNLRLEIVAELLAVGNREVYAEVDGFFRRVGVVHSEVRAYEQWIRGELAERREHLSPGDVLDRSAESKLWSACRQGKRVGRSPLRQAADLRKLWGTTLETCNKHARDG